jgi:hypothetical protein
MSAGLEHFMHIIQQAASSLAGPGRTSGSASSNSSSSSSTADSQPHNNKVCMPLSMPDMQLRHGIVLL